jgi:hypothetical protein
MKRGRRKSRDHDRGEHLMESEKTSINYERIGLRPLHAITAYHIDYSTSADMH